MKFGLKNNLSVLRLFIALIIISISFISGDCEKVLVNPVNPIPNDSLTSYDSLFLGSWNLIYQTGALQDICPDENVIFQPDFTAILTCPNSASIEREYFVDDTDSTLYYTQANIYYYSEFSELNQVLTLYGLNVSRNLTYEKIPASEIHPVIQEKTNFNNSSETEK